MSARSLELLIKRIDKRLATDIRESKLEKGGVSHSFRVSTAKLTDHFKSIYNLDEDTAGKAAGMVKTSLDTKFKGNSITEGKYTYYSAKSYGVLKRWKNTMSKDPDFLNLLGEGSVSFAEAFNIGHGSDKALAAVEYRTLLAYKEWQKFAKRYNIAENALDITFLESAAGKKLDLDDKTIKGQSYTTFTTTGNIKKTFALYVDLQPAKENIGPQAAEERKQNADFRKAIETALHKLVEHEDWEDSKASPSVIKYIESSIDETLEGQTIVSKPSKSSASSKVTKKKKKKKQLVTPTLATIKSKQAAARAAVKKVASTQRLQDPRGRLTSLVNVTSMINALLHGQLKENMKPPALQYRTGRFASSVSVTKMNFTREGQVTAFYEYMKRPYQTFERGFRQGNEFRDPRRLIDKSIREIAEMYIHKKFDLRTRRM